MYYEKKVLDERSSTTSSRRYSGYFRRTIREYLLSHDEALELKTLQKIMVFLLILVISITCKLLYFVIYLS